jgi:hypothetical protein
VHLIISPLTLILFSVRPFHFSESLNFIFKEISFVLWKVRPNKFTIAML